MWFNESYSSRILHGSGNGGKVRTILLPKAMMVRGNLLKTEIVPALICKIGEKVVVLIKNNNGPVNN